MLPPLIEAMMLSDVCLSVAYIGAKLTTERPRKTTYLQMHIFLNAQFCPSYALAVVLIQWLKRGG